VTLPAQIGQPQTSQLRLEQVTLMASVGAHYLLQEISCELFRGDCVGLIGPAGAGKTSLLRVLNRLVEVNRGQILFEERPFAQIPVIELRQQITLVAQESKLLGMTVGQALAYPLRLRGIEPKTIEHRTQICMDQLQIPSDWLGRFETQLSVGQRQMVAIARALMVQPKVLLLDEPTSALDVGRGEQLMQVLQHLLQTTSITVVMVNHQLELVQQLCNRVLLLQQGQLQLDLPSHQVDWRDIKQKLLDMMAQDAEAWDSF
jgi:D-methionine transport system ATP-binding protein